MKDHLPEKVELMKIRTMDRGRLGSPVSLPWSISMNSSSMEVFAGLLGNGSLKSEEEISHTSALFRTAHFQIYFKPDYKYIRNQ